MRISFSKSLFFVYFIFTWCVIIFYNYEIEAAHVNEMIYWISSDAPVYYEKSDQFLPRDFIESPWLFINLMPLFLYNILGGMLGYLLLVSLCGYFVFLSSLQYINPEYRLLYAVLLLIFPYTSLTFFSINKEIFALMSAIMLACYYKSYKVYYFLFALALAFCARSFLVVSYIFIVFIFPPMPTKKPKWLILFLVFIGISCIPFFVNSFIGFDFSYHTHEGAGRAASYLSRIISNGGYFLVYYVKYLLLLFSKFYQAFNVGFDFSNRVQDGHEFLVSLLTVIVFIASFYFFYVKKNLANKCFFYLALFSPVFLMFSSIFHWRYSSFVYVFYLFYLFSNDNQAVRNVRKLRI